MRETGIWTGAPLQDAGADLTDDQRLVDLAKKRDRSAWSTLFDRYYTLLYRYAYARLLSREEAEDAASQAFLNAYAAIDRFQYRDRSLLPWFYTITRNLVNEKHRKRAKAPEAEGVDLLADASKDSDLLIERIDLLQAVGKLNPGQREVILFRFALGLSLRETAAMTGKTEAAVHSLQVRALEALRRSMKH